MLFRSLKYFSGNILADRIVRCILYGSYKFSVRIRNDNDLISSTAPRGESGRTGLKCFVLQVFSNCYGGSSLAVQPSPAQSVEPCPAQPYLAQQPSPAQQTILILKMFNNKANGEVQ